MNSGGKRYDKYILEKIQSGEELSVGELRSLLGYEVDIEYLKDRECSRTNKSICKLGDKYYALIWEEGLIDPQENEFRNQPYEVRRHEYAKIVRAMEWVEVSSDKRVGKDAETSDGGLID